MEGTGTESLRKMAPQWSLAGDKQLLDMLQGLHERIVTKCQEANSGLEQMVTALDTASISLQNVNNRFMALSNSQFVESRVYDDDVDVATQEAPVKEPPKPVDPGSELMKLKDSLRVLESYHEGVHIVDSDSESGSDEEEDRMVYKPKDLYADRPLPYIIGSYQWRSKWHAGLIPEESDSDSEMSKPDAPLEQYSDSEPETGDLHTDKPHVSQRTISTTSSIGSELTIPTVGKPADIAAELARRLGGNVPHIPEPEPETPTSVTVPTKVYRPQQPTTATIFPDEPPPLDNYQSDESYQSESEDDIFAELHKKNPKRATPRDTTSVVDELFPNTHVSHTDGFADGRRQAVPPAKQSTPLFEDTQDSELFPEQPQKPNNPQQHKLPRQEIESETPTKKPVGGISLFGTNKGAESIGAAILKRNQRKNSTSEEEAENESPPNIGVKDTKDTVESKDKTQKDIINDLFTKPAKKAEKQKIGKAVSKKVEVPVKKVEVPAKKVDLFADDLFDDIDDIFTNVAPVKESKDVKRSLFDDDEDDLFANVAVSSNTNTSKPETKAKSIFDSDDDLFSDKYEEPNANTITKSSKIEKDTAQKPIVSNNSVITEKATPIQRSDIITDDNKTKIDNSKAISKETVPEKSSTKSSKAKSIFDSDSDDDIFSDFRTTNKSGLKKENKVDSVNKTGKEKTEVESDDFEKEDSLFLPKEVATNNKISIVNTQTTDNSKLRSTKIDEVLEDDSDSVFMEKEKTPEKPIKATNNEVHKIDDEFEDDLFIKKKTDKVLEESIENTPETKINSVSYSEQELFSSKNNESIARNDEISSILSNTKVLNAKVNSPSLFDDDDDDNIDNLFAKEYKNSSETDNKVNSKPEISKKPKVETVERAIKSEAVHRKDPIEEILKTPEIKSSKDNEFNDEIVDIIVVTKTEANIDKDKYLQPSLDSHNDEEIIEPDTAKVGTESNVSETKDKDIKSIEDLEQEVKSITESKQDINIPTDDDFEDDTVPIPKESVNKQLIGDKTEYDNKDFTEEPPLFSEPIPVSKEPDIFSDIFSDVPPEFERPKEPKKSKNVNALFDDDSDDEALFFKKNDVVTDDIPNVNFGTQEDRLFHIFHDEPPAIDVDFTQKPSKINDVKKIQNIDSEILHVESKDSDQIDTKTVSASIPETETNIVIDESKTADETKKPIGKLKPMNLNINVTSLLPGASPKKSKSNEQVDGQTISTDNSEAPKDDESKMVKSVSFEGDPDSEILDNKLSKERAKIQVKRRPSTRRARKEAVRKSGIDFGDDSTDNSSSTDISKREDVSDKVDSVVPKRDSNVNNEVRETPKTNIKDTTNKKVDERKVIDKPKIDTLLDSSEDTIKSKIKEKDINSTTNEGKAIDNARAEIVIDNSQDIFKDIKIKERINIDKPITETAKVNPVNIVTEIEQSKITEEETSLFSEGKTDSSSNIQETNGTAYSNRSQKSKVVYILNDEDIFTDAKSTTSKSKTLNIVDNDDDLFSSSKTNITTLGNAYKDTKKQKDIDNFDSDEDIFKASESKSNTNVPKAKDKVKRSKIDEEEAKIDKLFVKSQNAKVKSIFDDLSDEDDQLFGSKKSAKKSDVFESKASTSKVKSEVKMPKVEVKGSLFGDDSDDDLFGVKTAKNKEASQPVSKLKEVLSKSSEPVFEDPLSIFGQEDDL